MADFSTRLLAWYHEHGRKDLPWKQPVDAYRIWLSEIMLQQTQVTTVIGYFERFIQRFPRLNDLAVAEEDDVLSLWAGLGYYARGRNLHKAARIIRADHDGIFPRDMAQAMALPGVGRSTAAAILAQAYDLAEPILDANVKRVLCRHSGIHGYPGLRAVEKQLWEISAAHTPKNHAADYTQAIMDIGATLCKPRNPQCNRCPLSDDCVALACAQTQDLPTAKPKKKIPHKQLWWLLRSDGKQVLMQRRPAKGLWGGMLSFPEFESYAALVSAVGQAGQCLTPIAHSFSHFSASYTPVLVSLDTMLAEAHPDEQWVSAGELSQLALPSPVKNCLTTLLR